MLEGLVDAHNTEQAQPLWPSALEFPLLIGKRGEEDYVTADEYVYWPN
jgi:hypothetical protein